MTSHISERSKERTKALVSAKLEILETWARTEIPWLQDSQGNYVHDSDGERMLDFYPTREIHFAAWNGTQNCPATHALFPSVSSIKTTRRSTLAEPYHRDLHTRVEAVLGVLRAKGHEQLLATNKTSQLEKLESKAYYWEVLAKKQEGEIIALRERMYETEVKLRAAMLAIENNSAEHQRVVTSLNSKVANLTNLLSKVAPLK